MQWMQWKPIALDKLEKKYPNRSAHFAWGAVVVLLISLRLHPGWAFLISLGLGLVWEWGWAWVKGRGPEKRSEVLYNHLGWPKLGPRTYVVIEEATIKGVDLSLSPRFHAPTQLAACGKIEATCWTVKAVLWRGDQTCNRNNSSLIDLLTWYAGSGVAASILAIV